MHVIVELKHFLRFIIMKDPDIISDTQGENNNNNSNHFHQTHTRNPIFLSSHV